MPTKARLLKFTGAIRTPGKARVLSFRGDTDTTPRPHARILQFVATTTPAPRRRILKFTATTSPDLQGNAGSDQSVLPLQRVSLSGLASGGVVTSWLWVQTGGPHVALQPDATRPQPSFLAPATDAGTVVSFELNVADGLGDTDTSPDSVNITVAPQDNWLYLGGGVWQPYVNEAG